MVICMERDADLHMAQLMPLLLTVSCFSKIQIGFAFLVLAHLGSPGKGPLNRCVCVSCCSGLTCVECVARRSCVARISQCTSVFTAEIVRSSASGARRALLSSPSCVCTSASTLEPSPTRARTATDSSPAPPICRHTASSTCLPRIDRSMCVSTAASATAEHARCRHT